MEQARSLATAGLKLSPGEETFIYEPTYSRDRVTSRFLHGVFDGALGQVVLSLLQAKDASESELKELERLIAAARARKGLKTRSHG